MNAHAFKGLLNSLPGKSSQLSVKRVFSTSFEFFKLKITFLKNFCSDLFVITRKIYPQITYTNQVCSVCSLLPSLTVVVNGSPNCALLYFLGRQLPNVENHWCREHRFLNFFYSSTPSQKVKFLCIPLSKYNT